MISGMRMISIAIATKLSKTPTYIATGVASTVGLVCIEIYGYSELEAREFSEAWGIFMQLTNILRDVAEDAERDRIYLPMEDLRRYGISEADVKSGLNYSTTLDGSRLLKSTLKERKPTKIKHSNYFHYWIDSLDILRSYDGILRIHP